MALDDMRLRALLEQSHDLHTDAMETTRVALDEYVELAHDDPWQDVDPVTRRTTLLGGLPKSGVLAAAGLGTAMVALLASPAFADKTMDVQMLQTAASIENLAVATYETALTLDFIGGGSANGVVKAFVEKTKEQHGQHADAFNAAATRLGGKAQDQPDPVLLGVVNNAKPSLTGPAEVVDLAIELEDGAAQTYVATRATPDELLGSLAAASDSLTATFGSFKYFPAMTRHFSSGDMSALSSTDAMSGGAFGGFSTAFCSPPPSTGCCGCSFFTAGCTGRFSG